MAEGVLPNYQFTGVTTTDSDVFGGRIDQQFNANNTFFVRFNRSNARTTDLALHRSCNGPVIFQSIINYSQQAAVGITHLFSPTTILNLHFGYTYTNYFVGDQAAGTPLSTPSTSSRLCRSGMESHWVPTLGISNGYNGVSQFAIPLGPLEGFDYHADLSKVVGNHTIGVGAMYYHIHTFDDGWGSQHLYTEWDGAGRNGGSDWIWSGQFSLGVLNTFRPGSGVPERTRLSTGGALWTGPMESHEEIGSDGRIAVGLCRAADYHKVVSGLNVLNGQFIITQPFPPLFPSATGRESFSLPI